MSWRERARFNLANGGEARYAGTLRQWRFFQLLGSNPSSDEHSWPRMMTWSRRGGHFKHILAARVWL